MKSISYFIQTSEQISPDINWLSEGEQKTLSAFRFPKRRNDWLLGRWTAKQGIRASGVFGGVPLSNLEIRSADDGAPEVFLKGHPAAISISISHSRDMGLCAVAPKGEPVGCDLEWIEPRENNFAETYFTIEEQDKVRYSLPVDPSIVVSLIWSAKEAALKVLRAGLSRDTREVNISPCFGVSAETWNSWTGLCVKTSRLFHGWWRIGDGFVYTIASDNPTLHPKQA